MKKLFINLFLPGMLIQRLSGIQIKRAFLLPIILVMLLLSGCIFHSENNQQASGGVDFPNTISNAAFMLYGQSNAWKQIKNDSNSLPPKDSVPNIPKAPTAALAKRNAANGDIDTSYWVYSDSTKGLAYHIIHKKNGWFVQNDTLTTRYDSFARDSILGNEFAFSSHAHFQIFGTTHFNERLDKNQNGKLDWHKATSFYPNAGSTKTTIWILTETAGEDENLDSTTDNRRIETEEIQLVKTETVDIQTWHYQADTGSAASQFKGIMEYSHRTIDTTSTTLRYTVFSQKSIVDPITPSHEGVLKYDLTQFMKDGSQNAYELLGRDSSILIVKQDSFDVKYRYGSKEIDSIKSIELTFKLLTVKRPNISDTIILTEAKGFIDWKLGDLLSATGTLKYETISAGETKPPATISLSAQVRKGGIATLIGRFHLGLEADIQWPEADAFHGKWDVNGKRL